MSQKCPERGKKDSKLILLNCWKTARYENGLEVPSVVGSSPTLHPKNKSAAFMVADFVFDGVCLGEKPILRGPREF